MNILNKEIILAFRKYARYGFDRREADIFEMFKIVAGATSNNVEALKMMAVYETLRALLALGMNETVTMVREVYFKFPERPLKRNEVTMRVRRAAVELYMDERTVYRHLNTAKSLFLGFFDLQKNT